MKEKILQALGSVGTFLKVGFSKIMSILRKTAPLSVKVTNILKKVVEGELDNFAVALLNIKEVTIAHALLEKNIDSIAFKAAVFSLILSEDVKDSVTIDNVIEKLKELEPKLRANFWIRFAAELNIYLEDGKITLSEALAGTQIAFEAYKEHLRIKEQAKAVW